MSFCRRYVVFGISNNLVQIPNIFPAAISMAAAQQQSSFAAKNWCESKVILTSFAAIEIAVKLLGIWGRLWGPPKVCIQGYIKTP